MNWDNDDVFEMKTVGPLTFEDMIEHYSLLMGFIKNKFIRSKNGGIHIHISMKNREIENYVDHILYQYFTYEDLVYLICANTKSDWRDTEEPVVHRYNSYCDSFYGELPRYGDFMSLIRIFNNETMGISFNDGVGTLEFRMIDTGYNVERFESIATMLKNIVLYSYDKPFSRKLNNVNFYEHESRYREYEIERVKDFLDTIKVKDKKIKNKLLSLYKMNFTCQKKSVGKGIGNDLIIKGGFNDH